MFADKLLDKRNLVIIPSGIKPPADMQDVISAIPDALRFRIDNVYDYCSEFKDGEPIKWEDFINVRVSHEYTWYEWEVKTQGIQIGMLVESFLSDTQENVLENIGVTFIELSGGQVLHMGAINWENDLDGTMRNGIKTSAIPGTKDAENLVHNLMDVTLPTVLSAIMFINCKNVVTIDNEPSRNDQKRRARKNRPPLMTYKTIEIKPMTRALRDEGEIHKNGMKQALHICRGHFKDYRETGLFGKHKGLYWWETHVRGNESAGVVVKDYNVNPAR